MGIWPILRAHETTLRINPAPSAAELGNEVLDMPSQGLHGNLVPTPDGSPDKT